MSKEQSKQPLKPPSDVFKDCVRGAGSIVIECELCGRIHFGTGGDFDPGEQEELQKKSEQNPDKYIEHFDDDMVSYGYIAGKQAVIDCPCNELSRYENFMLSHRNLITRFLLEYAQSQYDDAAEMLEATRAAKAALEKLSERERKRELSNGRKRVFELD